MHDCLARTCFREHLILNFALYAPIYIPSIWSFNVYNEQSKFVFPHRLLIYNLLIFNVLLPLMSLLTRTEFTLLPIAIACSLLITLFIYYQANFVKHEKLIHAHWMIVWKRCRILLIAYLVSISVELLTGLMTLAQSDPQLREIMLIAFTRVAIVPTLLVVTPLLIYSTLTVRRIRQGTYALQAA